MNMSKSTAFTRRKMTSKIHSYTLLQCKSVDQKNLVDTQERALFLQDTVNVYLEKKQLQHLINLKLGL